MDDPAIDLGVVMAILSSNEDLPIDKTSCLQRKLVLEAKYALFNELNQRILEAEKLGFETIFVSKYNKITLKNTVIKEKL